MQTSNFFIKGFDPNAVSISRIMPTWYKGKYYEPLAPPIELVQSLMSGAINEIFFSKVYKERILNTMSPNDIIADLGMNAILLGNAKPGKFCHRLLVAEWLEATLGFEVCECKESTWLWP